MQQAGHGRFKPLRGPGASRAATAASGAAGAGGGPNATLELAAGTSVPVTVCVCVCARARLDWARRLCYGPSCAPAAAILRVGLQGLYYESAILRVGLQGLYYESAILRAGLKDYITSRLYYGPDFQDACAVPRPVPAAGGCDLQKPSTANNTLGM